MSRDKLVLRSGLKTLLIPASASIVGMRSSGGLVVVFPGAAIGCGADRVAAAEGPGVDLVGEETSHSQCWRRLREMARSPDRRIAGAFISAQDEFSRFLGEAWIPILKHVHQFGE